MRTIKDELILAGAIGALISGFAIITQMNNPVEAEINPNDRFFAKNFCANENTLLTDVKYTNNEELSYDSNGCPVSQKVIHRWNELSQSTQIIVTNRLATNGYVDVTDEIN